MSYRLLALAAAFAFVLAACSSSDESTLTPAVTVEPTAAPTPSVACTGGTKPDYVDQIRRVQWTLYCPTFLPDDAVLDEVEISPIAGQNISTFSFRLADGGTFDIVQGIVVIVPRNERDLPILDPVRTVLFGDISSGLFETKDDKPLVLSTPASEVTRAVGGSPGLDPEIVVAVAEGMRPLE